MNMILKKRETFGYGFWETLIEPLCNKVDKSECGNYRDVNYLVNKKAWFLEEANYLVE